MLWPDHRGDEGGKDVSEGIWSPNPELPQSHETAPGVTD